MGPRGGGPDPDAHPIFMYKVNLYIIKIWSLRLVCLITVVPLYTDVVFEEGQSFIRGRKQCKPKHVSSGIVVLNVRWSLIRVVSQEGDYCTTKVDRLCKVVVLQWSSLIS